MRSRRGDSSPSTRWLAALGIGIAVAQAAAAADDPMAKLPACQVCHGREGFSVAGDIPHLAGQRPAYLAQQLRAYRAGTRKDDLMTVVARQLTDAEIAALTTWWSQLPRPAAAAPGGGTPSAMTLPAGFPQGFREYAREQDAAARTLAISWANNVAWEAARAGKTLPDGAAIIIGNYAPRLDAAGAPVADSAGRWAPEKTLSYSAMEARAGWGDSVPPLLRNGNWHYNLFAPDGSARIGAQHGRCLACHQPKAADSYVFTLDKLRAAAARS